MSFAASLMEALGPVEITLDVITSAAFILDSISLLQCVNRILQADSLGQLPEHQANFFMENKDTVKASYRQISLNGSGLIAV